MFLLLLRLFLHWLIANIKPVVARVECYFRIPVPLQLRSTIGRWSGRRKRRKRRRGNGRKGDGGVREEKVGGGRRSPLLLALTV